MLQIRNVDMETQFQTSEILNISSCSYIPIYIYYYLKDKYCNRYAKNLRPLQGLNQLKMH